MENSPDIQGISDLIDRLQKGPISFKEYVELCSAKRIAEFTEFNFSSRFLDILSKSLAIAAKEMLEVCEGGSIYDFGVSHLEVVKRLANFLPNVKYFLVNHRHFSWEDAIDNVDSPDSIPENIPENVQLIDESEISDAKGVMITNKLFSMLPFHIVIKEEFKEVYVTYDGKNFSEILMDLKEDSGKEMREYLESVEDPRQRIEVCLEAIRMIRSMANKLSSGFIVTSDYLLDPSEMVEAERSSGTVTCYNETIHTHNPFLNPGRLVIRASVNLSALVEFGEDVGLKVTGLTNHIHLLKSTIGAVDEFSPELEKISGSKYRHSKLGSVKILIQQKGLRNPVLKSLKHVPNFSFWERYNLPYEGEVEILPEG
ncbi:MAG: SAM-dependent methyltransferase [Archaeoglobus sp.]|nr:SAM-dependent methyltransferase [Archaeoglobus sp.]